MFYSSRQPPAIWTNAINAKLCWLRCLSCILFIILYPSLVYC